LVRIQNIPDHIVPTFFGLFSAVTRVIAFIVKLLASALKQRNHVGRPYRFSASELVDGLSKLAMNDNNKVRLLFTKVLRMLNVKYLKTEIF